MKGRGEGRDTPPLKFIEPPYHQARNGYCTIATNVCRVGASYSAGMAAPVFEDTVVVNQLTRSQLNLQKLVVSCLDGRAQPRPYTAQFNNFHILLCMRMYMLLTASLH